MLVSVRGILTIVSVNMRTTTGHVFLALITVTSLTALPTSMTTLTLFTEKKNWNEALFICESRGGQLMHIKNPEMESIVDNLMSADPWKSALGFDKSFHIGIYSIGEGDPGVYTWSDCEGLGTWADWTSGQPSFPTEWLCLYYSDGIFSKGWKSTDCVADKKFVCESVGGSCNYNLVNNTRAVDSEPYDAGPISVIQCKELCDVVLSNGEECWAVTWSTTKCELHFAASSDYFDSSENIVSSSNKYLFKKKCLAALTSGQSYPLMTMNSWKPYSTCPGSSGNGNGIVYTIFNTNVTWAEAVWICSEIGQSLVVMETPTDGFMIQTLYGTYSGAYWIGMNGSATAGFFWIDGTAVSWSDFGTPPTGSQTSCVADTPNSNTWTTHACDEKRPFICQKTGGSCRYIKVENTRGNGGESQGQIYLSVCETNCVQTTNCVGYSFYIRLIPLSYECVHHVTTDENYLFNSANLQTGENSWDVYRYVCSHGLLFDQAPVIPEIIHGVNVTDLTIEESSSNPPQESSSISQESSNIEELSSAEMKSTFVADDQASSSISSIQYQQDMSSTDLTSEISTFSVIMDVTSTEILAEMSTSVSEVIYTTYTGYLSTDVFDISTEITSSMQVTLTTSGLNIEQTTLLEPNVFSTSVKDADQTVFPTTHENNVITSDLSELLTLTNNVFPSISSSSSTGLSVGAMSTNDQTTSPQTTSYLSTITTAVATPIFRPPESTILTFCPCKCHVRLYLSETSKLVASIRQDLLLEKSLLQQEIRKKISAEDERVSSRSMGAVAITFLSFVLVVTFLADISLLLAHFKMFLGNIFMKR